MDDEVAALPEEKIDTKSNFEKEEFTHFYTHAHTPPPPINFFLLSASINQK